MIEMRREKRWPIELQLEISSLFKQDNVKVENINAPIEVFDVSKAGIGFRYQKWCCRSVTILMPDWCSETKER